MPELTVNVGSMRNAASHAVDLLKTLANQDRLMLLCQLSQGECHVTELEQLLSIRQPTLSQQLGVLRNAGIVRTRREGKQIYYAIASGEATAMIGLLYRLYCKPAEAACGEPLPVHR